VKATLWEPLDAVFVILASMAEVVRTPIGLDARLPTRRTFDERLMVRWPGAWAALSRALQALPPRSRLRRALLRQSALSGWGAWVRGDLDLCLVRFSPDYHYDAPQAWLIAGMPSVYQGHAGLREWSAELREAWEILDHTPLEVVDAGDVIAFLCKIRLRARASGIELDSRLGQVFWIERGLIVRERDFSDWDEALRVVGAPTAAEESGRPRRVTSSP
jgi:ketosteroid isomerase-like protein